MFFLSYHGGMAIDIKLLLAWHPFLFLFGEGGVKGGDRLGIVTAIGGGAGDIRPLFALQCIGDKLGDQQSRWEIALSYKADDLLFKAYEASGYVVTRITEVDIYVVSHFTRYCEGVLYQYFPQLLSLVLRRNAERAEGQYLLTLAVFLLKPSLGIHDIAHYLAVQFQNEGKLGNEVGMASHSVYEIMLVCARLVDVPERLSGQLLHRAIVLFGFKADGYIVHAKFVLSLKNFLRYEEFRGRYYVCFL